MWLWLWNDERVLRFKFWVWTHGRIYDYILGSDCIVSCLDCQTIAKSKQSADKYKEKKMKKNTMFVSMIFVILLVAGFFLIGGNLSSGVSGATIGTVSGDVQIVKMYVKGSQYVFEPSSVRKGTPVRLEADISKMPGCSKSVISSELNIKKNFNSVDNTFEFTPNKAGTFYIACSMNMYKGTLTVLESDGSKSNYVQTPTASGSSCGANGGGCGCGG